MLSRLCSYFHVHDSKLNRQILTRMADKYPTSCQWVQTYSCFFLSWNSSFSECTLALIDVLGESGESQKCPELRLINVEATYTPIEMALSTFEIWDGIMNRGGAQDPQAQRTLVMLVVYLKKRAPFALVQVLFAICQLYTTWRQVGG